MVLNATIACALSGSSNCMKCASHLPHLNMYNVSLQVLAAATITTQQIYLEMP